MILAEAVPIITRNWLVDLGTVCTVGGTVLIGVWRLLWWMKKIDARLDIGEKRFDYIESRMKDRDDRLSRIEDKLDRHMQMRHR